MNNNDKNKLIAEFLGWIWYEPTLEGAAKGYAQYRHWIAPPGYGNWNENVYPLNYFVDLNAIVSLTNSQSKHVRRDIADIIWNDADSKSDAINASAATRADAFGKVLGLWK